MECCRGGKLDSAKRIYSAGRIVLPTTEFNLVKYNNDDPFVEACSNGHLEMAKWLYNIGQPLDINMVWALQYASECGHITVVQWLTHITSTIVWLTHITSTTSETLKCVILSYIGSMFRETCFNGHLDVAQWLYKTYPDINMIRDLDYVFGWSCRNGHLEVAQWLYSTISTIDIHTHDDWAFHWACFNGHARVVIWLMSLQPCYDYNIFTALAYCCQGGHIDIMKLLYRQSILRGQSVDIHATIRKFYPIQGTLAHMACKNQYMEIIGWLYSIDPTISEHCCMCKEYITGNIPRAI